MMCWGVKHNRHVFHRKERNTPFVPFYLTELPHTSKIRMVCSFRKDPSLGQNQREKRKVDLII